MNNIRTDDLLRLLPHVLRKDQSFHAFAVVVAKQLRKVIDSIDIVTIYARIDALPEEVLDILAYDFKVDWWDYNYSVEQKRQTLKDSWLVHKHLGTKYAVETAISAIYPNSTVEEWFEFDGEPYTFRLHINASGVAVDEKQNARVLDLTNYYKNLRSHLCGVQYVTEAKEKAVFRVGGYFGAMVHIRLPEVEDDLIFAENIMIGGSLASVTRLQIPGIADA